MIELFFMSIDVLSYIVWEAWINFFIRISALVLLVGLFIYFISRIELEENDNK
jgi:hypothetical protein